MCYIFRLLNYPSHDLYWATASETIERAFQVWSDVTPLTFREVTGGYANMYLQFGRYYHGDYYPFDGVGGTLAHAFLPGSFYGESELEGDVHFDDDETFTVRSSEGKNEQVYLVYLPHSSHR